MLGVVDDQTSVDASATHPAMPSPMFKRSSLISPPTGPVATFNTSCSPVRIDQEQTTGFTLKKFCHRGDDHFEQRRKVDRELSGDHLWTRMPRVVLGTDEMMDPSRDPKPGQYPRGEDLLGRILAAAMLTRNPSRKRC